MERETRKFIKKVEDLFESGDVSIWEFKKLITEWEQLISDHCYMDNCAKKIYRKLHQAQLYVKWYRWQHRARKNEDLSEFLEALIEYINVEINSVDLSCDEQEETTDISGTQGDTLSWTASKRSLIELISALDTVKCINGGNIKTQKIVESFERLFDVKLDYYFTEINKMSLRKPDDNNELRSYFLNKLVDGFNRKMLNTR